MALLIGAEFESHEDSLAARDAVRGLGIVLDRDLVLEPSSPSRGHSIPGGDGPLILRARRFDRRLARGATGGAIIVGTSLAIALAPAGLVLLGATTGAALGAIIGSVVAATSARPEADDAMRLMMEVSSAGSWVLLFEVQRSSEVRAIREVLEAWGGRQLDPWREERHAGTTARSQE